MYLGKYENAIFLIVNVYVVMANFKKSVGV
jgi:hypothetical protein